MKLIRILSLAVLSLLFAFSALADLASYTVPLPAPSPVLSTSIDDIPPSAINALLYDGTLHPARANFLLSYIEVNANDQRVWFNPAAAEALAAICYNRRYRADANSPWYWQYSVSPVLQVVTDNPGVQPWNRPPSIVTSQVLYDPVNQFYSGSAYYPFIMYTVWQPSTCNGVVGGFLHISFSSDGTTWSAPRQVIRPGGSEYPCWSGHLNTMAVESAGAVYDGAQIYLSAVEGDFTLLADPNNMDNPYTYIATSARSSPGTVWFYDNPNISAQNLVGNSWSYGTTYGSGSPINRFYTYQYFFNMQLAYDDVHGDIYLSRAYPYGYDRIGGGGYPVTPFATIVYDKKLVNPENGLQTTVEGCAGSPGTLPNRIQIYKKHIGALSNFGSLGTSYWTLVADYGLDVGYLAASNPNNPFGSPFNPPANQYMQTNVGRDLMSANFVTDGFGHLKFYNSTAYFLGGDGYASLLSRGPCRVTGLERSTLYALPQ